MNEQLLQFIWRFQYFNLQNMLSEEQEPIEIINTGNLNVHQGPDFLEAKIKVGNTLLVGSVELHIKSSDWHLHKHHLDEKYNNVILHVVWENDKPASIQQKFATLVLQPRVSIFLLEKYEKLMQKESFVACQNQLPFLNSISWLQWQERLIVERLERKSIEIISLLNENKGHWEETFWQLLAKNFGIKVNAEIFFNLAKSISINILAKHKNQIHQLEALLFGTVNLLPQNTDDDYAKILQREYKILSHKYSLAQLPSSPLFLRMRPANFPSIRLAQLAMLIHQSTHLFSKIKDAETVKDFYDLLNVAPNDYWLYHYRLGDDSGEFRKKNLGKNMIENIIINTIVPVTFAYGLFNNAQKYKDKAIDWLLQLSAEKNSIIDKWKSFHVEINNALVSQSMLELKKHYCDTKNCLACNVGRAILSAK